MKWILLTADHATYPPTVETTEFPDADSDGAFAAYLDATLAKSDQQEVVLFRAESLDALRRSHPRYFFTRKEIIENLRESLSSRSSRRRSSSEGRADARMKISA